MKFVSANLIAPHALGRVWTTDVALREALEASPRLVFVSGPDGWVIQYRLRTERGVVRTRTLCKGPVATKLFGAEMFRKLTGKEVAA